MSRRRSRTPTAWSKNEKWKDAIFERLNQVVENRTELKCPWQMLDFYYLGDMFAAKNTARLKALGVTHVVNCAAGDMTADYSSTDVQCLEIKALDNFDYNMKQHFEEAYEFIENARREGGKVMVHCMAGVNRSGFITVAYVMKHLKLDLLSAIDYCVLRRGFFLSNHTFQRQLVVFAREEHLLTDKKACTIM